MKEKVKEKIFKKLVNNYAFFCNKGELFVVELTPKVLKGERVLTKKLTVESYKNQEIIGKIIN